MKLTGWFSQDKIADNSRVQTPNNANTEQVNRQIRALVPGQTLRGEVVSREGNNAQIRLLQDVLVDAKVDADIRLDLGQNITFQVKSNGQIGEFHGFSLNASYDSFYQTYKLTIKRQCSYQIEIGKDVLGNLQRISNALTGIEKRLTEAEQKMENLLSQLATAQEEVEKPFPKEAELTEKMERLAELNSLLNMDEKGTSEALGMGEDIAAVADSPRCAVTMAGRVSELSHTADSVQKPSVLGKLKQAQERLSHEAKNWKHTAKKKEQQL